jgi:hypothetical protein
MTKNWVEKGAFSPFFIIKPSRTPDKTVIYILEIYEILIYVGLQVASVVSISWRFGRMNLPALQYRDH